MTESTNQPKSCCLYRRKIVIGIIAVLTEEQCGVPDSELADLVRFDGPKSPCGKPILNARFCPWCGKARESGGAERISEAVQPEDL